MLPLTVVFVEIPTNPDMKVQFFFLLQNLKPNPTPVLLLGPKYPRPCSHAQRVLRSQRQVRFSLKNSHQPLTLGRRVLLLVDTTFTPASGVMRALAEANSELAVMCFISLSKSVSRWVTARKFLLFAFRSVESSPYLRLQC